MPPKRKAAAKSATTKTSPKRRKPSQSAVSSGAKRGKTTKAKENLGHFSYERCEKWFQEFLLDDDEPGRIGPDGIEKLCEDLVISVESMAILILAWKLNADEMGYFSKQQWLLGMTKLDVDSTAKLQTLLTKLQAATIHNSSDYKELYRFSFSFAKNKDQKSLDLESAIAMWEVLFSPIPSYHEKIRRFLQFLQEKRPVKVINKDQWMSVLDFVQTVEQDLSNYDISSAWPTLLDEYVEWANSSGTDGCS